MTSTIARRRKVTLASWMHTMTMLVLAVAVVACGADDSRSGGQTVDTTAGYPDTTVSASTRLKVVKRTVGGAWVEIPPMQTSTQVWDFGFAIGKDDSLHLALADGDSQATHRTVRYVHRTGCSGP